MALDLNALANAAGNALLDGTVVEVETTVTPAIRLDLTPPSGPNPPGGLSQQLLTFLKPKVVVYRAGTPIAVEMPYGDPADAPPWGLIIAGALGLGVTLWVLAR